MGPINKCIMLNEITYVKDKESNYTFGNDTT
jgi:hypothetical protein